MSEEIPEGAQPIDLNGQPLTAGSLPLVPGETPKPVWTPKGPIQLQLADGKTVDMARPKIALSEPLARILADVTFKDPIMMQSERQRVRCLLYITHINGQEIMTIGDPISRKALEERIGDEFLDDVFIEWSNHFINSVSPVVLKKS